MVMIFLKEKKASRLCVVQKKMDPGMFVWVVLLHQQHPKVNIYKALYQWWQYWNFQYWECQNSEKKHEIWQSFVGQKLG